jgi:hypothetical protein
LTPFDGQEDYSGTSGFRREYGPSDPNHPKTVTGTGEPIHWQTDRVWPLVGEGMTAIRVRMEQSWTMVYDQAAWVSPHGYSLWFDHGDAVLDFRIEAVHESGRIQR